MDVEQPPLQYPAEEVRSASDVPRPREPVPTHTPLPLGFRRCVKFQLNFCKFVTVHGGDPPTTWVARLDYVVYSKPSNIISGVPSLHFPSDQVWVLPEASTKLALKGLPFGSFKPAIKVPQFTRKPPGSVSICGPFVVAQTIRRTEESNFGRKAAAEIAAISAANSLRESFISGDWPPHKLHQIPMTRSGGRAHFSSVILQHMVPIEIRGHQSSVWNNWRIIPRNFLRRTRRTSHSRFLAGFGSCRFTARMA